MLTLSGVVIDAEHGWLVCSPDDLVRDSSAGADEHGLVECKCPYKTPALAYIFFWQASSTLISLTE